MPFLQLLPQSFEMVHQTIRRTKNASKRNRIPASVWELGFVSMFMDLSSETIHALLPLFLVSVLGATATAVGMAVKRIVAKTFVPADAPPGVHPNVFCVVRVPRGDAWIVQQTPPTQLRIDVPLPSELNEAKPDAL